MPELSRFYGIVIYMYRELGGRHHSPHIHAESSGAKAVFNIETATLENYMSDLTDWVILRFELMAQFTLRLYFVDNIGGIH